MTRGENINCAEKLNMHATIRHRIVQIATSNTQWKLNAVDFSHKMGFMPTVLRSNDIEFCFWNFLRRLFANNFLFPFSISHVCQPIVLDFAL